MCKWPQESLGREPKCEDFGCTPVECAGTPNKHCCITIYEEELEQENTENLKGLP